MSCSYTTYDMICLFMYAIKLDMFVYDIKLNWTSNSFLSHPLYIDTEILVNYKINTELTQV